MRLLFVAVALTLAYLVIGCSPVHAAEIPPQCTLPPPQDTLAFATKSPACTCPTGGPCVCTPDNCRCVGCPVHRADGVAMNADDAEQAARKFNCGLVAFAGVPVRPISGAVAYQLPVGTSGPRIWAGTVNGGAWLPADATESAIMGACHPGQVVVGHQKVCDDKGCRVLPIFAYTNAALAAPQMGAYYQPMSYGGNCGGGG